MDYRTVENTQKLTTGFVTYILRSVKNTYSCAIDQDKGRVQAITDVTICSL